LEDLGSGFWWKLIGVVALCGIAIFIIFEIFMRAVYAFGVLGFFVGLLIVLLVIKWVTERRRPQGGVS
jgi:hypothetical protein